MRSNPSGPTKKVKELKGLKVGKTFLSTLFFFNPTPSISPYFSEYTRKQNP